MNLVIRSCSEHMSIELGSSADGIHVRDETVASAFLRFVRKTHCKTEIVIFCLEPMKQERPVIKCHTEAS